MRCKGETTERKQCTKIFRAYFKVQPGAGWSSVYVGTQYSEKNECGWLVTEANVRCCCHNPAQSARSNPDIGFNQCYYTNSDWTTSIAIEGKSSKGSNFRNIDLINDVKKYTKKPLGGSTATIIMKSAYNFIFGERDEEIQKLDAIKALFKENGHDVRFDIWDREELRLNQISRITSRWKRREIQRKAREKKENEKNPNYKFVALIWNECKEEVIAYEIPELVESALYLKQYTFIPSNARSTFEDCFNFVGQDFCHVVDSVGGVMGMSVGLDSNRCNVPLAASYYCGSECIDSWVGMDEALKKG